MNTATLGTSYLNTESDRFLTIADRALNGDADSRLKAIVNLSEYLMFSQQSNRLFDLLIRLCVRHKSPYSLDFAVDILAKTDSLFQRFVRQYLETEIQNSNRFQGKWQPDEDYWYVLLRALAKCSDKDESLAMISVCQDETSLGIAEAVIESLAELETDNSRQLLKHLAENHGNEEAREMAEEYLNESE